MRTGHFDEVQSFSDGELIVREGEEGRDMFIVQHGEVEISKRAGVKEVTLAVLGRGSFFGEMSLLESLPRSATVRARGEARLLVIRSGSLLLKIRRDPTFAFEMLQHMSHRIRLLDDRLIAALGAQPGTPCAEDASIVTAGLEFQAKAGARPEGR